MAACVGLGGGAGRRCARRTDYREPAARAGHLSTVRGIGGQLPRSPSTASTSNTSPRPRAGNLHVGTLTTAEMLAATRTAEDAVAVWLSAALRDMREDLPRAWYGDTVVLLDTVRPTASGLLAGPQDPGHRPPPPSS